MSSPAAGLKSESLFPMDDLDFLLVSVDLGRDSNNSEAAHGRIHSVNRRSRTHPVISARTRREAVLRRQERQMAR